MQELRLALGPTGQRSRQESEGLFAGQRVGEVPEVLLRGHAGEQCPERQARAFRVEVPERVHDGADGHVHDALLRAEPAQLRVVDEFAPDAAHVGEERFDIATDEISLVRCDGRALHVVAAAYREHETVARETVGGIRENSHVPCRVVRIAVHGIGAI